MLRFREVSGDVFYVKSLITIGGIDFYDSSCYQFVQYEDER